jgi:tRNA pseudouridine65 synthase
MVIDHPLARIRDDYATPSAAAPAQAATTLLRRLAALELPQPDDRHPTSRYALVDLEPRTGRRHQLRRHLKHAAHPIIGDATYGKGRHNRFIAERVGVARLWLHALSIAFPHPATGVPLTITAPPGADWQRVLALPGWRWDAGDDVTPPAGIPAALRAAAPSPLR